MDKKIGLIVILNVYTRKNEGLYLQKLLNISAEKLGIKVLISFDDGSLGVWKNFQQALSIGKNEYSHRLMLHDDMLIERGAIEKINHILPFVPEGGYFNIYNPDNTDYEKAIAAGKRIMKTDTNFWSQATVYPEDDIKNFLAFNNENTKDDYPWEDRRLAFYLQATKKSMFCLIPGLAQHLGAFRSTFGFPGKIVKKKRYSASFDGSQNVETVDWTKEFSQPYLSRMVNDHANVIAKEEFLKNNLNKK